MSEIPNLKAFPFHVKQKNQYFCIPASIEAILRYYDPETKYDQDMIYESYKRTGKPFYQISFKTIAEALEKDLEAYQFEVIPVIPTFDEWLSRVKSCINEKVPVLISLAAPDGWHIRVVVDYNDKGLWVHDPDPTLRKEKLLMMNDELKTGHSKPGGKDLLIIRRK